MLVLSRKHGEKVCVGDGIVLTVLEVLGRRVKIGIAAPPQVPVVRGELVGSPPGRSPKADRRDRS